MNDLLELRAAEKPTHQRAPLGPSSRAVVLRSLLPSQKLTEERLPSISPRAAAEERSVSGEWTAR
jgi:hypothetical protein